MSSFSHPHDRATHFRGLQSNSHHSPDWQQGPHSAGQWYLELLFWPSEELSSGHSGAEFTQQSRIIALTVHFAPLCGPHKSTLDEPLCVTPPFREYCEIQSFFLAGVSKFQLFKESGYKAQQFSLFRLFLLHGNSFYVSNNLFLLTIYIMYINIHRH